jgi:hypothetical protein
VFQFFAAASFQSLWYWTLHVVVWTLACYRTLGVPHDMLLRARRRPEVAERVDQLAHLACERVGGIYDSLGVPLSALTGFLLAGVFSLGFLAGIEAAQAAFAIMLPLAVITYSKLRLALAVRRKRMLGSELVLALARRRVWHQFFAVLGMLGAAGLAMALHPRIPLP